MVYADEFSGVLRMESQMPSSKCELIDHAFTRLSGVLTRMNLYEIKAQNLRRQLEESKESVKSAQQWKEEFLETVYRQERLEHCLDRMEELENLLESRLERLERRRLVDVGVQAGEAGRSNPSHGCRRRQAWLPGAALALCSAFLLVGGLLSSVWSRGWGSVVIHIGPKPL